MDGFSATYSPDDNKLRLYADSRLTPELYARVKAAGFIWAPKQQLFVAPMWTPDREDLCVELAGELEDEDKSLVERAEERAERFEAYSENRAADADRAHDAVSEITKYIPLGQPILVGHHSEKRARRDAEKIENGMRKAVKMWEQSKYWQERAAGAISHAKYKELPNVRARRIKKLEAERRTHERAIAEAEHSLKLWTKPGLDHDAALIIAGHSRAGYLSLPHKEGDKEGWQQCPSAYDALTGDFPNLYAPRTLEEIIEVARTKYPRIIAHNKRWIEHIDNRLLYERAMLAEAGGILADRIKLELGGAVRCWASPGFGKGWAFIQKVNKVTVTIFDKSDYSERFFNVKMPFDKLKGVMNKQQVDEARERGQLRGEDKIGFFLAVPAPDQEPPRKTEAATTNQKAEKFQAMKQQLRAGVQVAVAEQLFPTPPELAARMVEEAQIKPGDTILEPSAGTGNIITAALCNGTTNNVQVTAIEINPTLCDGLRKRFPGVPVEETDFLEVEAAREGNCELIIKSLPHAFYDKILMNPPFSKGQDIRHIIHALSFLKGSGRLVAICANGPRQNEELKPLVEDYGGTWEPLPDGTFHDSGTEVNAVLIVLDKRQEEEDIPVAAEQQDLFGQTNERR